MQQQSQRVLSLDPQPEAAGDQTLPPDLVAGPWLQHVPAATFDAPHAATLSGAAPHAHPRAAQVQQAAADLSAPRVDRRAMDMQDDGYELFRRAIEERDADAWAVIHARYRPLLIAWVQRCSATAHCGETPSDLADLALARVWAALSPARFAHFPNLPALMAYLRACVSSVVIDLARAQASRRITQPVDQRAQIPSLEQTVLDALETAAFWRAVTAQTANQAERVVVTESFIYSLPPRAIQARHPSIFADVSVVYTTKRNLLKRLQHNAELLRLRREWP
jgi:DNA-directed RNA polymerase specialized sigma24 family protein